MLRDVSDGSPVNTPEIGDGVLSASKRGHSIFRQLLQRIGLPRTEPSNLHRLGYYNPAYFREGSQAQQFLCEKGYEFQK